MNTRLMSIAYPVISPIAFQFFSIQISWYGLSYMMGILCGWWSSIIANKTIQFTGSISDLLSNIMIGLIVGGRIGYVTIYNPTYYATNPSEIIAIWNGGMSFHGGAIGAAIGCWLYCRKRNHSIISTLDLLAISVPPGLFLGRIANFINGELYGRESHVAWSMIFPTGGAISRHPSQLYEALLEGILLGVILWLVLRFMYQKGRLFTCFLFGYGICRFFVEFTRSPDDHIGLLALDLSMGQFLSIFMIIVGGVWHYVIHKQLLH